MLQMHFREVTIYNPMALNDSRFSKGSNAGSRFCFTHLEFHGHAEKGTLSETDRLPEESDGYQNAP